MEQQTIPTAKTDITATLVSRTSVLAAANPLAGDLVLHQQQFHPELHAASVPSAWLY